MSKKTKSQAEKNYHEHIARTAKRLLPDNQNSCSNVRKTGGRVRPDEILICMLGDRSRYSSLAPARESADAL